MRPPRNSGQTVGRDGALALRHGAGGRRAGGGLDGVWQGSATWRVAPRQSVAVTVAGADPRRPSATFHGHREAKPTSRRFAQSPTESQTRTRDKAAANTAGHGGTWAPSIGMPLLGAHPPTRPERSRTRADLHPGVTSPPAWPPSVPSGARGSCVPGRGGLARQASACPAQRGPGATPFGAAIGPVAHGRRVAPPADAVVGIASTTSHRGSGHGRPRPRSIFRCHRQSRQLRPCRPSPPPASRSCPRFARRCRPSGRGPCSWG